MRKWWIITLAVVQLSVLSLAAEKTVWRIGKYDQASAEFKGQDIDYANPKSDPVFRVGKSADADWYRFQPGPANGMTGGRLHPFTILFDLPQQPKGLYKLKFAILYETPRLSHLRVEVNGHAGLIYFHPKLDYAAGDWEGTFVPQTSMDTKSLEIPTNFLKQGENKIVITALDDPSTVENSLGAIAPGHTGIVYDALELLNDSDRKYDAKAVSAEIFPSIFYRSSHGETREIVEVFGAFGSLASEGTVSLTVAGKSLKQDIRPKEEFGEQRLEFEVPEWNGVAKSKVSLRSGPASRTLSMQLSPAKKWTVYIIPHEHLDIGFTDYPARVAELHSESVDGAMKLIEQHPDFKWTLDGLWVAHQYMAGRPEDRQKKFLDYVRSGQVVIPPEFANQHTGNASWEGLARSLYGSHIFAKQHNLPTSDAAQIVDVPSYAWPYASVLADSGIKYFVAASNSWRAPIMLQGRWNEKSPFYWEGPDGKRVMMWYSRAYLQLHTLFGGPWRMSAIRDALPIYLQAYTRPDYTANSALIFGSQLENTALGKEQAQLVEEYSKQYSYPQLQFATVAEAMSAIDREFGGKLPVYRGDFGPYWEDGYGSDAIITASHRANQSRILSAEKLGTLPAVLRGDVLPDAGLLNDAWVNQLLVDEHTWTFVGATTQPENQQSLDQISLKRERSTEGERQIGESIQRSWGQFAAMLAPGDTSVAVFNPLSWERSGLIELDLLDGTEIVDSTTGKSVPFEVEWKGKGISLPGFGPGYRRVQFLAENIPSVGYKLFALKPAAGSQTSEAGTMSGNVMENAYYRVTLDPETASIKSIFDKKLGKDIVDSASAYRFGQYLYVSGGDDYPNNSLYRYGAALKPPQLTVHGATGGKLVSVKKSPYGTVATMQASAMNTPTLRTEVVLFDNEKKIEIRYSLHKDRVLNRESVYFAFPFGVAKPEFNYANQVGWVNPAKDELAGGSREWYLAHEWASVSGAEFTAAVTPLDAPLVNFGDIMRGKWPTEFTPASATIFSWVMNNYWGTNFQAWQGGDFTFRYAITSSDKFEPAALTRFGSEALTPLESAGVAASFGKTRLPVEGTSLLKVDDPSAMVTTWKLAEDGDGSILRIQDIGGQASKVRLSSPYLRFTQAWECSPLEDNRAQLSVQDGTVEVTLEPFQVKTVRVHTQSVLPKTE
ncbi:MAG TPA: polysaccharide lyase family protein [Terriglobales bacterium]